MNRKLLRHANAHTTTLLGILLIAASFSLGCFEYEETLTIHRDGSGEMEVHYAGDADADMNLGHFKLSKDEHEMRAKIEEKFTGPGVRLKSYQSKIKGEDRHVYFTVAFDDFTRLASLRWWDDQQIEAGQKAGDHFWKRIISGDDNDPDDNSKFERWLKDKIADELEAHLKLRFVIQTEGEIIETNARERAPHRVAWRFDGADFLSPEGLKMKLVWR